MPSKWVTGSIVNCLLVLLGAAVVLYLYPLISGLMPLYDPPLLRWLISIFGSKWGLYLTLFVTDIVVAMLLASVIYFLALFFRSHHIVLGIVSALLGLSILAIMVNPFFDEHGLRHTAVIVLQIISWVLVVVFSGVASLLACRSRLRFARLGARVEES